jgi:hypothetical protein
LSFSFLASNLSYLPRRSRVLAPSLEEESQGEAPQGEDDADEDHLLHVHKIPVLK